MKKTSIFCLALVVATASAAASDIRFGLRATVPTICNITDVAISETNDKQLEISSNCNAAALKIHLSDEFSSKTFVSANSGEASTFLQGDGVFLRPDRPGEITLKIQFEEDISDVTDGQIHLETY